MAELHMALDEVTATALNSDARDWTEVAGRGFSSVRPVLHEPPNVPHQGSQKGTALHHTSHISGPAIFYPNFYPNRRRGGAGMLYLLVTAIDRSDLQECVTSLPRWSCGFDSRRPLCVLKAY
jgi:hypothetical protein